MWIKTYLGRVFYARHQEDQTCSIMVTLFCHIYSAMKALEDILEGWWVFWVRTEAEVNTWLAASPVRERALECIRDVTET